MVSASDPPVFDSRVPRRRLARLVTPEEDLNRLPRALAERLMEHLEPIRRDPLRVLEVGTGPRELTEALRRRYPAAQIISAADVAALLHGRRQKRRFWARARNQLVCAERLPLRNASVDLIVGNLPLIRTGDVTDALTEWRRVLRHDGLLMISALGPATLGELAEAWQRVDATAHLHPYLDMHELGDALVRAGFADVVMDAERLRMEFDDLRHLLHEVRRLGGGNAHPHRRRSLTSPRRLTALEQVYPEHAPGPACWASVEAVFAHGWAIDRGGVAVSPPRLVPE